MIMVQSTFHVLPESRANILEMMKEMVRLCREEHGCVSYEYFEGITDRNQIILLQEWDTAENLQDHYQTTHMQKFIKNLGDYLESDVVTRSYVSPNEPPVASKLTDEKAKPEQTIH